jgi:TatD DNase family protein
VLIDTHAHLTAPALTADAGDVLERCTLAGVGTVICVGYDVPTSRAAVCLARRDARVFATVGVHPNDVAGAPEDWKETIRELADDPRVVAIGESGLDYYRDSTPPAEQMAALEWHMSLAAELGLPLVLHNRESDDDLTSAVTAWARRRSDASMPGVLHSFCASESMMKTCTAAGFAISFSGMVTFPNRSLAHLADLVRRAPTEALLVETDSPYLAPVPHRGRRNEPVFVREVAQRVADLRGVSLAEVEHLTTTNARRVFPRLGTSDLG